MKTSGLDPDFQLTTNIPVYRQIAAALRDQIVSGKVAPGTVLESTEELAQRWKASYFTVHTALKLLVKEGLLDRIHGTGTTVRERSSALSIAGIYFGGNVWLGEAGAGYHRMVCHFLQERLAASGVKTEVFIDTRPKDQQRTLLPSLKRALETKAIQCLIAPHVNPIEGIAMSKLPIPYAFIAAEAGRSRNRTHSDMRQFWRGAFSHLIEQGCRTVGVISGFSTATVGGLSKSNRRAWTLFREEMAISGLETKEDWLTGPDNEDAELTRFGYHAFHQLWRQPKKPEALIVYPDVVARGVILRAL